jgi:hypothetical protein
MDTSQIITEFYKFSNGEHTYDEWFNKFFGLSMMRCGDCSTFPFWIFKNLVMDNFCCTPLIPIEYELDLFLKCINVYGNIEDNYSRMLRTMLNREPEQHKQCRIAEVQAQLADYIDSDGYVQAYRGFFESPSTVDCLVKPKSFGIKKALSYTLDKDIAYWFACRKEPKTATIISARVPVERILLYTNERSEKEVMVIPPLIKGKKFLDIVEEIVAFDKEKMDKIDATLHKNKDSINVG